MLEKKDGAKELEYENKMKRNQNWWSLRGRSKGEMGEYGERSITGYGINANTSEKGK